MVFPTRYNSLINNNFEKGEFSIGAIRYQDRWDIMQWRNEQMYHLRQKELLTKENQESYFQEVVFQLFQEDNPNQLLFSYLKNGKCIGYGGLVHINWEVKTAEVSFIMKTKLEKNEFEIHWTNFLFLLKKVAFDSLQFTAIFTYAYNLRPHLYPVLEKNGFIQKEILKNELEIEGKQVDVLIHECPNPISLLTTRECRPKDMEIIFNWSNDPLVRSQSFNSDPISKEGHEKWFRQKLANPNSLLFINEYSGKPAGLVRFEIEKENAVIGILLAEEQRGKGISHWMLKKSVATYFESFDKPVLAYIKETNQASIRAFEKAGFTFYKKDTVNEFPTLVYKIEKNGK